jgi:hypothetical protein
MAMALKRKQLTAVRYWYNEQEGGAKKNENDLFTF